MLFHCFVSVSTGNEKRPGVIIHGKRLLSSPSLPSCDHPYYLAVFIYFHVRSEEVLLDFYGAVNSYQCS